MREKVEPLSRFIVTSMVSTARFYVWLPREALPANLLVVFARQDDYFFGMLHSRSHEVWALAQGSDLGKGDDPRYNTIRCFETFPLPWPPGNEPAEDPRVQAIADAARDLNDMREKWLDPPDADEGELRKRTLTNLYNARPAWLVHAHAALDHAVWAAYGWDDSPPEETSDERILSRLLALNRGHANTSSAKDGGTET
jgi:type II restriction/modification system DNA methylase subunit YeeA